MVEEEIRIGAVADVDDRAAREHEADARHHDRARDVLRVDVPALPRCGEDRAGEDPADVGGVVDLDVAALQILREAEQEEERDPRAHLLRERSLDPLRADAEHEDGADQTADRAGRTDAEGCAREPSPDRAARAAGDPRRDVEREEARRTHRPLEERTNLPEDEQVEAEMEERAVEEDARHQRLEAAVGDRPERVVRAEPAEHLGRDRDHRLRAPREPHERGEHAEVHGDERRRDRRVPEAARSLVPGAGSTGPRLCGPGVAHGQEA